MSLREGGSPEGGATGAAAGGAGATEAPAALRTEMALVVDDCRTTRRIIGSILSELGFEVRRAENGLVGLEVLAHPPYPGLALVDWNMPELNGMDFLRAVRKLAVLADLKVMMVTTRNQLHELQQALELGADEYVMKPFDRDMILEKLQVLGYPLPSRGAEEPGAPPPGAQGSGMKGS